MLLIAVKLIQLHVYYHRQGLKHNYSHLSSQGITSVNDTLYIYSWLRRGFNSIWPKNKNLKKVVLKIYLLGSVFWQQYAIQPTILPESNWAVILCGCHFNMVATSVLGISIFHLSTIFRLDFGTVATCIFGIYFKTF
jgi:hypothetical protein